MNGLANGMYGGDLVNSTNAWIDFSEQTTKQIRYKVVGNIVYVYFSINGTSNSTSTSFTLPIQTKFFGVQYCYGVDNTSTPQVSIVSQPSTPGIIFAIYRFTASNNLSLTWTASGTKTVTGSFFYEI
jgi:hypothetical protein